MSDPFKTIAGVKAKVWLMLGEKRIAPGTLLLEDDLPEAEAKSLLAAGLIVLVDAEGQELCTKCYGYRGERLCSRACWAKAGGPEDEYGAHVSAWEAKTLLRGLPKYASDSPAPADPPSLDPPPSLTPPAEGSAPASATPPKGRGGKKAESKDAPPPDGAAGGTPPATTTTA